MANSLDFRVSKLGYDSYEHYLRSPYWLEFSDRVRKRKCYCCGWASWCLHVHHLCYDRLGCERDDDVETLCLKCHAKTHEKVRQGEPLATAHLKVLDEIVAMRRKRARNKAKKIKVRKEKVIKLEWVSLDDLLSLKLTADLADFLLKRLLLCLRRPTNRAYELGFAKNDAGEDRWSVGKCQALVKAWKDYERLQRRGEIIPLEVYRAALVQPPVAA